MRRRALLAALAGAIPAASAGCVTDGSDGDDGDSGGDCDDVAVDDASVRVDYVCDYGPSTDAEVRGTASTCTGTLTIELLDGGDVVEARTVDAAPEWTATVDLDAPIDPGETAIRVRGPDGTVLAERTVAVEHYRDAPRLSIWHPAVEPDPVAVGEPVTATLTVGNVGGATDCDRASGPTIELSHAFDAPGEYGIELALTVDDPAGYGNEADLGTVTVES